MLPYAFLCFSFPEQKYFLLLLFYQEVPITGLAIEKTVYVNSLFFCLCSVLTEGNSADEKAGTVSVVLISHIFE